MKKRYNIAVIPGDGTGPEVVAEGIKALEAVSRRSSMEFSFEEIPIGGELYLKEGILLPDKVIEGLRSADAVLLGAIGHPEVKPGILEREILLRLRFELDLYINLRPVTLLPGVKTPLRDKGPRDIDFVVIRENTEGLYAGGGGFFKKGTPDEIAIQDSITTRKGVERCLRYAYDLCRRRNKAKTLTLCGKSNVLLFESDLWVRAFEELHASYPDIAVQYQNVDALCMWMIKNPERCDVIVTNNIFGDIITDIGAAIQGGLGISAGGNINPEGTAIFEPIGGSAPKYKGLNLINPLAAILSAQMMLEHLGEPDAATILLEAVKTAVKNDIKALEAGKMGFGTREVGDLVAGYISGIKPQP